MFDGVLQFAHISRPIVGFQQAQRCGIELARAAVNGAEPRQKMRSQRRNIRPALAQRRNGNRQHVQAEKKIFAETSGGDRFGQIGIGERHQARFHVQRFGAAQAFECALFEHAQQLCLHAGRERRHFVEHDRSALRHFQAAGFARDRAGERAAFVAEKFGFDQLGRQAGAVDFQKGSIVARAAFMNPARELIFPRAAFAGDQNRGRGVGDFFGEFENAPRSGIGRDPGNLRGGHGSRS